jgi:hypothetical protein
MVEQIENETERISDEQATGFHVAQYSQLERWPSDLGLRCPLQPLPLRHRHF